MVALPQQMTHSMSLYLHQHLLTQLLLKVKATLYLFVTEFLATIGGTGYSTAGTIGHRTFHSGRGLIMYIRINTIVFYIPAT